MKKLFAVFLVLAIMFSFGGCMDSNPLIGTWELDLEAMIDAENLNESEASMVRVQLQTMDMRLTFDAEGYVTIYLKLDGMSREVKSRCSVKSNEFIFLDESEDDTVPYTLKDGKLTIYYAGNYMILSRVLGS